MIRRRHLLWICMVSTIALFPVGATARGRYISAYDGEVDFGSQLLHLDRGCLFVDGNVTSGTFFNDLKRIDISGEFEYRKDGKAITTYPDSLSTSIRIVGNQCAPVSANAAFTMFNGDSYSLKFEVAWKDGMALRPATLAPGVASCRGYNSITIPDKGFSIPTVTCQLTVSGKGVPLSDHLIVSIFTPGGEPITRLSAAP